MFFVRTCYSLRYGVHTPEELLESAIQKNISCLALCDINNTTVWFEIYNVALAANIRIIPATSIFTQHLHRYTLLAKNNLGLEYIHRFYSHYNLNHLEYPHSLSPSEIDTYFKGQVYIIYPYPLFPNRPLHADERIGITPADINRFHIHKPPHIPASSCLAFLCVTALSPLNITLHHYLRAVDMNTLLSKVENIYTASPLEYFYTSRDVQKIYELCPDLLLHTKKLFESCEWKNESKSSLNRKTFTGNHYDDKMLLEKLAKEGILRRYGNSCLQATQRVKHELQIIDKLGFASYFLITWDIIRYSLSRGFYHVGRGSGANSVVAYCLQITDVDPIELDLYFERFLNPKRSSPPDFDIDYSWKERDDVLEYIFRRYGHEHTALLGTISTFKDRSIIRELGKVVGLPKAEIDLLVAGRHSKKQVDSHASQIMKLYNRMKDMPNQRSIHAGGVLISEKNIYNYTALDLPPKGFPTVQWDMYTAEAIGFEKFDILSQRGIGHIKEAASLVLENRKIRIDIHDIPAFKNDPGIHQQLKSGDTIGCFYIESPAMRGLLKKLRCSNYISLVAASSIIRPGVARSGMMKTYIERFHNPSKIIYLHPVMQQQLSETYGVMVYQEDVLKVCHHFAGLDLADADVLRRAMSGKFRGKKEFQKIIDKFFEQSRQIGHPEPLIKEVWRQIESFAGYSFSKAHSASFAVESFQSLFLKTYYPLEFMVAVINNFGGYYRTSVYMYEILKAGGRLHLPCVNNSRVSTHLYNTDVYIGFNHIAGIECEVMENIYNERKYAGNYAHLSDFIQRTGITLEQLILLIRCGALRFTGYNKKQLLWQAHGILGEQRSGVKEKGRGLFPIPSKTYSLPDMQQTLVEDAFDELELLGFPVTLSLFELLKTNYRGHTAQTLETLAGKKIKLTGALVTYKPVQTIKKQMMAFGTFTDQKGHFFDTTHFPNCLTRWPFTGGGCYLIEGTVVLDFGFPSVQVERMAKLPIVNDPRYA